VLSWLAPIIVFGLVVFVHELGHFIAAKLTGVYAPRFSIGFGPSLLKKRFGETEYVLAALPLGGYVRMASREDEATAFLEGGSENSAVKPGSPMVRVQVTPRATLHHAGGRDNERAARLRDLFRPAASLGHSDAGAGRRSGELRKTGCARRNTSRR